MKIDRIKFWIAYKDEFGKVDQSQVGAIEFLLDNFSANPFWRNLRHIAYALATIAHETNWSFEPVEEGYYLGTPAKVKAFQKTLRYFPYFGRGYVQLTWKKNYLAAGKYLGKDLQHQPELALDADIAFDVMTWGMSKGMFTGKKLSDYITASKTDYKNARRIINGTDKADLIASYAEKFEQILKDSNSTDQPKSDVANNTAREITPTPSVDKLEASPLTQNGGGAEDLPEFTEGTRPADDVVQVPQAKPEANDSKINEIKNDLRQETQSQIKARFIAIPGMILGSLSALWERIIAGETNLLYWLIGAVVALAVVYIVVIKWQDFHQRKTAAEKEKNENELKLRREQQAFELTVLQAKSAMDKTLQTIVISPQPIENSDA